jgi:predicted adenine nucleotide alpha hydrolase (AANH) superfamily ATPase
MANRINYQRLLDRLLEKIAQEGKTPSLLLHSCCAPCSSYVLEYLSSFFHITLFFYNPNIYPQEEYDLRLSEVKRLVNEINTNHPIKIIEGDYIPDVFYKAVRGMEQEEECGERCHACYHLRLEETARLAQKLGFDYFTTTLSIGPKKDSNKINEIAEEIAEIYKTYHLPSDFKRKKGYERSIVLSREHNLYRQNYCGCIFSRKKNP